MRSQRGRQGGHEPRRCWAVMVLLLGLLAAGAFALGNVLQQKGTLEAPAGDNDVHGSDVLVPEFAAPEAYYQT